MVNEGFCAPCQRMLANEDIPKQRGKARWHHVDGGSFQQSLDMGCHICTQSWVKFDRPGVLGPTKYSLSKENSSEFHEFSISHYIRPQEGYDSAYFVAQPWSIQHAQLIGKGRIASNSDTWLSDSTGSDQSFEFLASKYRECLLHHRKCSVALAGRYMPTRLLDINDEDADSVRLVDMIRSTRGAYYVTVSHCWGNSISFKLIQSTETSLRGGIPISRLPRTFEHAVVVARKMNLRYLWIDSL